MIDKENQYIIECDECKYEFLLRSVIIYEVEVDCLGEILTLSFFVCPKCNKIYKVALEDAKSKILKSELNEAKKKLRKLYGSKNIELANKRSLVLDKKLKRLKKYMQDLNRKYSGTFTFAASENNSKGVKIIYHE